MEYRPVSARCILLHRSAARKGRRYSAFQLAALTCIRVAKTSNPKVAGSIPARPIAESPASADLSSLEGSTDQPRATCGQHGLRNQPLTDHVARLELIASTRRRHPLDSSRRGCFDGSSRFPRRGHGASQPARPVLARAGTRRLAAGPHLAVRHEHPDTAREQPPDPVVLFLYGGMTAELAAVCDEHRVMVHDQGRYEQRLAMLCPEAGRRSPGIRCSTSSSTSASSRQSSVAGSLLRLRHGLPRRRRGAVRPVRRADVVAREEVHSGTKSLRRRSRASSTSRCSARLAAQRRHAPVPPFNLGVVLLNNGVWRRLVPLDALLVDYAWRFVTWMGQHPAEGAAAAYGSLGAAEARTSVRPGRPGPSAALPLGQPLDPRRGGAVARARPRPGSQDRRLRPGDVAQNGEFARSDLRPAPWIVCHYYSQNLGRIDAWMRQSDTRRGLTTIRRLPWLRRSPSRGGAARGRRAGRATRRSRTGSSRWPHPARSGAFPCSSPACSPGRTVGNFVSEADLVGEPSTCWPTPASRSSRRTRFMINIAGPREHVRDGVRHHARCRGAADDQAAGRRGDATFIDTTDTDVPGLIAPSGTRFEEVARGRRDRGAGLSGHAGACSRRLSTTGTSTCPRTSRSAATPTRRIAAAPPAAA